MSLANLDYLDLSVSQEYTISPVITDRLNLNTSYNIYENCARKISEYSNVLRTLDVDKAETFKHILQDYLREIEVWILKLPKKELVRLVINPIPVELFLRIGDLFDDLIERVLKADNELEEIRSLLKIIQRLQYCQYLAPDRLHEQVTILLYLILLDKESAVDSFALNGIDKHSGIIVELLKVFSERYHVIRMLFSTSSKTKAMVESCQKECFHLNGLWKQNSVNVSLTFTCFLDNLPNFIYLLQSCGVFDFNDASFQNLKKVVLRTFSDFVDDEDVRPFLQYHEKHYPPETTYRCLQIIHLHYTHFYPPLRIEALKYLTLSTSEPFLTMDYFRELNIVHRWYRFVLNLPDVVHKTPRSLKHLSRCVLRRRLALCFQFPHFNADIPIPKRLYNYIYFHDLDDLS